MAIREENKKVEDNLTYRETKNNMQKSNGIQIADLSTKMNTKQINDYINAYKNGDPVKDLLPPDLTKEELLQLEALAKKRT